MNGGASYKRRWLLPIIIVICIVTTCVFLIVVDSIRYKSVAAIKCKPFVEYADFALDGDLIVKLRGDVKSDTLAITALKLSKSQLTILTGSVEIKNLNPEALDHLGPIESVTIVQVSEGRQIDSAVAAKLRSTFPRCTLWTFSRLVWNSDLKQELAAFPAGSYITCYDPPPPLEESFSNLGEVGISWMGEVNE